MSDKALKRREKNKRNRIRRICQGKLRFGTKIGALIKAAKVEKKKGVKLDAYQCDICHGFHMTSKEGEE